MPSKEQILRANLKKFNNLYINIILYTEMENHLSPHQKNIRKMKIS